MSEFGDRQKIKFCMDTYGVGKATGCLLHRAFPKASAEASEKGRVALRWIGVFSVFYSSFLANGFSSPLYLWNPFLCETPSFLERCFKNPNLDLFQLGFSPGHGIKTVWSFW